MASNVNENSKLEWLNVSTLHNNYLLWMRAHPAPGLHNHREHGHGLLSQCWNRPQTSSRFRHFHCQSRLRAVHHQTTRSSTPGFYHSCSHWWREHVKKRVRNKHIFEDDFLLAASRNWPAAITRWSHMVSARSGWGSVWFLLLWGSAGLVWVVFLEGQRERKQTELWEAMSDNLLVLF